MSTSTDAEAEFTRTLAEFDADIERDRAEAAVIHQRLGESLDLRRLLVREYADTLTDEQVLADERLFQCLMYNLVTSSDGEPRIDRMLPREYQRPLHASGYRTLDADTREPTDSYDNPFFVPAFQLIITRSADLAEAAAKVIEYGERFRFGCPEVVMSVLERHLSMRGSVRLAYTDAEHSQVYINSRTEHIGTLADCLAYIQREWYYTDLGEDGHDEDEDYGPDY